MIQRGKAPFLECSSKGDRRFSAFYAKPASLKGRSIEEAYQAMKILEDGRSGLSPKEAKGKKAVNQNACKRAYWRWWYEWVSEQNLLPALKEAAGLSDIFGQDGHVCQAAVLWDIRNGISVDTEEINGR